MGKRYSKEEINRINELANHGLTNEKIAQKMGRTTNGIRNIRHRKNLRTQTRNTINKLNQRKLELQKTTSNLQYEINKLETRHQEITKVLKFNEQVLTKRIENSLQKKGSDSRPAPRF